MAVVFHLLSCQTSYASLLIEDERLRELVELDD